jgi:hypothetical protein
MFVLWVWMKYMELMLFKSEWSFVLYFSYYRIRKNHYLVNISLLYNSNIHNSRQSKNLTKHTIIRDGIICCLMYPDKMYRSDFKQTEVSK